MILVKVGLAIGNTAVYIQHKVNKHLENEASAAYHLREGSQKNYDLSTDGNQSLPLAGNRHLVRSLSLTWMMLDQCEKYKGSLM